MLQPKNQSRHDRDKDIIYKWEVCATFWNLLLIWFKWEGLSVVLEWMGCVFEILNSWVFSGILNFGFPEVYYYEYVLLLQLDVNTIFSFTFDQQLLNHKWLILNHVFK